MFLGEELEEFDQMVENEYRNKPKIINSIDYYYYLFLTFGILFIITTFVNFWVTYDYFTKYSFSDFSFSDIF